MQPASDENQQQLEQRQQVEQKTPVDGQVKLGLLMVNLGIAPKDEIFPNGVPNEAYTMLTSLKDNGIIAPRNVSSSGAKVGPVKWYNPSSWFQRRARPSSYETNVEDSHRIPTAARVAVAPPHALSATPIDAALQIASEMSHAPPHDEKKPEASNQLKAPSVTATAAAAPQIDYRQLKDSEVRALAPSTQADRKKLLGMEEGIHTMLESIERTKAEYLTPAKELACEADIEAVVACYHRANLQLSVMEHSDTMSRGRLLLQCGGAVDRLAMCSDAAVRKYVEE